MIKIMNIKKLSADEYYALMSEEEHQIMLFKELYALAQINPIFDKPFHIPNGGLRDKATAGKMKAAGVKRGVPDIFIPLACNGYHGLFIEMKSTKKGTKLTKPQEHRIKHLKEDGFNVTVCYGWREALQVIKDYLLQ